MIAKLLTPAALLPLLMGAALAPVAPVNADEPLGTILARIAEELLEHPDDYLERNERAWLMVEHGMTKAPLAEDIDTLLTKPAWRGQGLRLSAVRLSLLGRHAEAKVQARRNIKTGGDAIGAEQYRLIADAELAVKDTAAAVRAYREGWETLRHEEDYISMVGLSRGKNGVSDKLLAEGLRFYASSPGVHAVVFKAYMKNEDPASLRKALELSNKGQTVLWPLSVDWKIRHAQALLASRKRDSAETVLLRAMDMLEGDTRLHADAEVAVRLRREIFELLDAARARG